MYSVLIATLLLISSFSISGAFRLQNDDFSIVRQRVLELMIWPPVQNIPDTVKNAWLYMQALNSTCYWPSINYADKSLANWGADEHLTKTTVMFKALTVPGSTVQNDTKLLSAAHCALNVWLVHDWQNPNWWYNQIGTPLATASYLLMLGDTATDFEIEKIKNISYRADWWQRDPGTGANLVWMIQIQLYRSLATYNSTGVQQGFTRMWKDIAVLPLGGQGIQSDWSYLYHGTMILSASYGQTWAIDILAFILCSINTQYQVDPQKLSLFANFLTQGNAWMTIRNVWDWNVLGRDIARPNNQLLVGIRSSWVRSLAQLAELNNNSRADLLNWADRLDGRSNASPLVGNKHFYTSDYQVHRRANWTSAIKMQSVRTNPSECINDENQKGEHIGQGVLNLYTTTGDDYLQIFPLLDWQAINGITVEHDITLEPCKNGGFYLKKLSFVGGVSDASYGLAMMDTATHNLTAKRSWHFYDDAIIALASKLTLTARSTAWTTLASRLLPSGQITVGFFNTTIVSLPDGKYSFPYTSSATSNVQWLHVGGRGIGYILQTQGQYSALGVEIGIRTGNFHTIGPFNSTKTARMLNVWIDHGLGPYTLDYRYMVLPNVSADSMPALVKRYNQEQVFSCISTNAHFHGTAWPTLKRASFVLWQNTSTSFTCQSPSFQITAQLTDSGAYLFSETDTDFSVTASHPTRVSGTVTVTVDRIGHGKECTVSSGLDASTTHVALSLPSSPQLLGASVTVTCKKS